MATQEPHARKPRVLLAASGSVAAVKGESLSRGLSEWAHVRAVATKSSLHFIDTASFPRGVTLYTDDDEWSSWKRLGGEVLHMELRKWADAMVIAPTVGQHVGHAKPVYVAPAMNTFMWDNPFTKRHLVVLSELGVSLISPVTKRLACGDYGHGAMAEPSEICRTVRLFFGQ